MLAMSTASLRVYCSHSKEGGVHFCLFRWNSSLDLLICLSAYLQTRPMLPIPKVIKASHEAPGKTVAQMARIEAPAARSMGVPETISRNRPQWPKPRRHYSGVSAPAAECLCGAQWLFWTGTAVVWSSFVVRNSDSGSACMTNKILWSCASHASKSRSRRGSPWLCTLKKARVGTERCVSCPVGGTPLIGP